MRRNALWLGLVVTTGLIASVGAPVPGWGQSIERSLGVGYNGHVEPANDSAILVLLPPVVETVGAAAASPAQFSAAPTDSRLAALEAKVAELDAQLHSLANDADQVDDVQVDKAQGYVIGSDTLMTGKWWPDGLTFASKHGDFRCHLRGLAQLDYVAIQTPGPGIGVPPDSSTADGVDFRRLRLGMEGTMYETIDYIFELDFAMALQNVDPTNPAQTYTGLRAIGGIDPGNTINLIQPTNVFLTFKDLPLINNIRVGSQQDWISLEHIESPRFLDFMERSPIMDAFNGPTNNGYTPGISAFRMTENQKAAIEVGAYANNAYDGSSTYSIGNNAFTYGGRTTWTPYYDEATDGRYLLHLGFGSEFRTFNTENLGNGSTAAGPVSGQGGCNIRVRSRGDLRTASSALTPNYADTGNFYVANQTLLNPEIAFQWGSWLLQAEYERSSFGGAATTQGGRSLGNISFDGGYVEVLYFLTGEHRTYNRQSGVFNRVIPIENAHLVRGVGCCGWGAWQVGARYDYLDLNSGAVNGGYEQDMTLGLNWFLNPNARLQFNYVCTWINNAPSATAAGTYGSLNGSRFTGDGPINQFGGRMDFNF